ncbi:MAG: N-acetyltransferase family protein [Phycisphaerales bacterium]
MTSRETTLTFRRDVRAADEHAVRDVVERTGFFRDDEVEVACELVRERLSRSASSGYEFIFADDAHGRMLGYACFGPIACTVGSFDLFWIVVDPAAQRGGLGGALLERVEREVASLGGRTLYAETSSLPKYAPTRAFYERRGFMLEARLRDFYQVGDDKLVYGKPAPRD